MIEAVFSGMIVFTLVVVALAIVVLLARYKMVNTSDVNVIINSDESEPIKASAGSKLLQTLSDRGIFLPSACGGGGTCAQCKCQVESGAGSILPTEAPYFTRPQIAEGWRLSCQVAVKQDIRIKLPPELFGIKKWTCKVISNNNVATFIKELVLELPENENVDFKAGGYVQLEIPPYELKFSDFDIDKEYHPDWDLYNLWDVKTKIDEPTVRAYSMANYPEEKGMLKFNIRIATAPPNTNFPPGRMSSYVFNLKPGDEITVYGPFGEFFVKPTNAEMVYIGGGAGMAPLRSHIFDLLKRLKSNRKISYWYGARSLRELFYDDEFKELEAKNPNFKWNVAMSDPLPEDNWKGYTGFIHNVLYESYLKNHPAPEDCEYYMCGPPVMNEAVKKMLDDLGIDPKNIYLDDFGE